MPSSGQLHAVEARPVRRLEVANGDAIGGDDHDGVRAGDPRVVEAHVRGRRAADHVLAPAEGDDATGADPADHTQLHRPPIRAIRGRVVGTRDRQQDATQQRGSPEDVCVGHQPPLDPEPTPGDAGDVRQL